MFFECICRQTFCLLKQFGLLSFRQLTPSLHQKTQNQTLQTWFCEGGLVQSSIQSINQNASVSYSRVLWDHECPAVATEQLREKIPLVSLETPDLPPDRQRNDHSYSTSEIEEMREIINRRAIRKPKPLSKTKLKRKANPEEPASILRYERRNPTARYRFISTQPDPQQRSHSANARPEHKSLLMHVLQGKTSGEGHVSLQATPLSPRSKPVFDIQSLVADEFVF